MKTDDFLSLWDAICQTDNETLFIDRNGSINKLLPNGAPPTDIKEVEFLPCFIGACDKLAKRFRHIIVLSYIHPGMEGKTPTRSQEKAINDYVRDEVEKAGGRIDGFYTTLADDCQDPSAAGPMLPLEARRDFPSISFDKSLMVGVTQSDRLLAYNCGMHFMCLSSRSELSTLVDFDNIDTELAGFRKDIMGNIEVLNKLMNSAVRIRGIRLLARCCCHAMASNNKTIIICDSDSALVTDLSMARQISSNIVVLNREPNNPLPERLRRIGSNGDVVMCFSATGKSDEIIETMETAVKCGMTTGTITGGKPTMIDMSDVVIKIPSTSLTYIQSNFRLILGMLRDFIQREKIDHNIF